MVVIKESELKRGIETDYPARDGKIKAIRWNPGTERYEFYDIKTGEVDYSYADGQLSTLVRAVNHIYGMHDTVEEGELKFFDLIPRVERVLRNIKKEPIFKDVPMRTVAEEGLLRVYAEVSHYLREYFQILFDYYIKDHYLEQVTGGVFNVAEGTHDITEEDIKKTRRLAYAEAGADFEDLSERKETEEKPDMELVKRFEGLGLTTAHSHALEESVRKGKISETEALRQAEEVGGGIEKDWEHEFSFEEYYSGAWHLGRSPSLGFKTFSEAENEAIRIQGKTKNLMRVVEYDYKGAEIRNMKTHTVGPRALPTVKMKGKLYFRDDRLREFRNVDNPHDRITFEEYQKEFPRSEETLSTAIVKGVTYYFKREKDGLHMWAFGPPDSEEADYVGRFDTKKEAIEHLRE